MFTPPVCLPSPPLTGESHAGHYIPCMAKYILQRNAEVLKSGGKGGLVIHIDGLAIGNGWIDPFYQYDVSDYAHGQGLISDGQRQTMKVRWREEKGERERERQIDRQTEKEKEKEKEREVESVC